MWLLESLQDNYEVPVALVFGILFIWLYKRILKHPDDDNEKSILEGNKHNNNNTPAKHDKKVHFDDEQKPAPKKAEVRVETPRKPPDTAALRSAVRSGDVDKVKTLLEEGANPSIPDRDGNNALHIIFKDISTMPLEDAEQIFQSLLSYTTKDKAPAVNSLNIDNNTPLHLAVSNTTPSLVRMLLDCGADRNIPGKDGNTPLHTIIEYMQFSQVPAEMDILNLLVTHKQPEVTIKDGGINAVNDDQLTPLHLAVINEESANMKLLVEAGADPNITDSDGNTPLHTLLMNMNQSEALCAQNREMLTTLLKAKADVVRTNTKGQSALCLVTSPEIEEEILST